MRVLAGDIGGTKTLLQIADVYPNNYQVRFEKSYASGDYNAFLPLLKDFLKEAAGYADMILNSAGFGVAGPIRHRKVKTTNLPWILDADAIGRELGIPQVHLINDFQAIGYGLDVLSEDDFFTLQEGNGNGNGVKNGTRALIGAGTGLGHGILYWYQDHHEILPSEGGHTDFAPTNRLQLDLLAYLMERLGKVSNEDIISGTGLVNIYSFLRDRDPTRENPELAQAMIAGDPAAAISTFAFEHQDPIADQALDVFCEAYGSQAGNLALTCLATGGVYIAGGIAPKIIEKLKTGAFIRAFNNKSKMQSLLETVPVKVVMNSKAGLMGAASRAARGAT